MAMLKCKMCGGELVLEENSVVAECEYCGSRQTIPSDNNDKKLNLFNRANTQRMKNEFDRAEALYESIASDFPDEAEAYWGICLCRYGIEYVDDPKTEKKIPTCHRTRFDSIFDDESYKLALEKADVVAQKIYRDEARAIDNLQKDILAVVNKEEPYDVFICYKETDEKGERTVDSVLAQDIYDALTAKNYRVFFSRITLEDKLGVEYEPYIFAALNSAKIMLVIGTKYEYFNAVWVKNEWSRFLELMKNDRSRSLFPCYKDIDPYDIPEEFRNLQGQNMGKIGAIQDLVRGISKIIPKEKPQPVQQVVVQQQQGAMSQQVVYQQGGSNAANLVRLGFMDLESGNEQSAYKSFREAIGSEAGYVGAYIGLLSLSSLGEQEVETYYKKLIGIAYEITDAEKEFYSDNNCKDLFDLFIEYECYSRAEYLIKTFPQVAEDSEVYFEQLIKDNNNEFLKLLIDNGVDVNCEIEWKTTDSNGKKIDCTSTALGFALLNNKDIARLLINHGADANRSISKKYADGTLTVSFVNAAIEDEDYDILSALIEKGADTNSRAQIAFTANGVLIRSQALYTAIYTKASDEIVEKLLDSGADPNATYDVRGKHQKTICALYLATAFGNKKTVELLLKHGADPNLCNELSVDVHDTALVKAVMSRNADITELLLKNGADANVAAKPNGIELYALTAALKMNNASLVRLLIEHGANIDNTGFNVPTVALTTDLDCINVLAEHGTDLSVVSVNTKKKGEMPLLSYMISKKCSVEVIEMLIANGVQVNAKFAEGITGPLGSAIEASVDHVNCLLKHGANVKEVYCCKDSKDKTIHIKRSMVDLALCVNASDDVIFALLDAGHSPHDGAENTYDDDSTTYESPLFTALHYGRYEVFEKLIQKGADANARYIRNTGVETSLLLWAVNTECSNKGEPDLRYINLLLEHGADVNHVSSWGSDGDDCITPLVRALIDSRADLIDLLLQQKPNLDVKIRLFKINLPIKEYPFQDKIKGFDMYKTYAKQLQLRGWTPAKYYSTSSQPLINYSKEVKLQPTQVVATPAVVERSVTPDFYSTPSAITNHHTVKAKGPNRFIAFFLCFFLGMFGVHKFYEKKIGMGILYLFTAGLFGIGWLIDVFILGARMIKGD